MANFNFRSESQGFDPLTSNAISNQALGALSKAGGVAAPGNGLTPTNPGGGFFGEGGGASIALGGLQTLGSIWSSFQQMKLAKKSLKFQKDAFKTNLANSTQVYNTALEDRIRARYVTEGKSTAQADQKIAENSL